MTFLIDGADNNDFLGNNIVVNPNPDAVDEFKIITNNYTAEYGRTSGGIVNQVIKSGTNAIHGSAFEFFRNTALDASDYFLQEVPVLRRNLFGGTIGFPIKKDKMFFFASYQGTRRSEGQNPGPIQVLSPNERTGDFSELLAGANPIQLVNPATGNNYPNNQVPVDPVIANYINNYLPSPNRPGNTFVADPVASIKDNQFIFRSTTTFHRKTCCRRCTCLTIIRTHIRSRSLTALQAEVMSRSDRALPIISAIRMPRSLGLAPSPPPWSMN